MIESLRFKDAIQFGGEVVNTLVVGKNGSTATYTEQGVRLQYTITNPNNGMKIYKQLLVPYSNLLFIAEEPEHARSAVSPEKQSPKQDKAR